MNAMKIIALILIGIMLILSIQYSQFMIVVFVIAGLSAFLILGLGLYLKFLKKLRSTFLIFSSIFICFSVYINLPIFNLRNKVTIGMINSTIPKLINNTPKSDADYHRFEARSLTEKILAHKTNFEVDGNFYHIRYFQKPFGPFHSFDSEKMEWFFEE